MRLRTLAGLTALAACAAPREIAVESRPPPATAPVVLVAAPPHAPAPPRSNPCPPLPAGRTSDDEAPSIRGVGAPRTALEWFVARGVTKDTAARWWTTRFGDAADLESAMCLGLEVGEDAEDALVCLSASRTGFTRQRLATIVVRTKVPVVVLDVPIGLGAMDWPDARHLDLALSFASDGRSAELRDRAPDGTILVEPPSACRAREKLYDECEKIVKEGGTPPPMCPILVEADGTKKVLRAPESFIGSMAYPATLHDCAGAKKSMAELRKGNGPAFAAEATGAAAFIDKACRERGHYVWKRNRFVLVNP